MQENANTGIQTAAIRALVSLAVLLCFTYFIAMIIVLLWVK